MMDNVVKNAPAASESTMSQNSERLVVFVTPAQKRVLAARAARMGISLSELVRRAVLAFDDTGQEVRAAGLVDRLGAASEASRNDTLRRLAQAQTQTQTQTQAATHGRGGAGTAQSVDGSLVSGGDFSAPAAPDTSATEGSTALPVAAAVARALVAQEAAQSDEPVDAETEALVARVIHPASEGPV